MVFGEEEMAVVDERHAEQGDERADYDELDERGTALARAEIIATDQSTRNVRTPNTVLMEN